MANTLFYDNLTDKNAYLILFNRYGVISTNRVGLLNTIGRPTAENTPDIAINSLIVSRSHGEILCSDGTYFYRDVGSTNGTYVNSSLLRCGSAELHDGDMLCFDIVSGDQHHPDRVFGLFMLSSEDNFNWSTLPLDSSIAEIAIGRRAEADLKLDSPMISENHASFFNSVNGWAIIDHKSTNGVYLNRKRLSSPRYLKDFDVVRIVGNVFIFTENAIWYSGAVPTMPFAAPDTPVYIAEENVKPAPDGRLVINIIERSVVQRFKKLALLQDINLTVSQGEMVLILGGSGAGKTTFINAVMGYEKAKGKITYNDTDIYEEYEQMKYEIGFVPQQDLVRGSDTVYSTLSNAAEMKLPKSTDTDALERRIDEVLISLGLSREKDTLVSKLSGGQKKRLSIAVELIADPALFFLDEPDSGVDDIMGRGLMENLRAIADDGKIVMVITHSPERAADLFDKVIVLAKSTKDNCGHLAFFGGVDDAFKFFETDSFRGIVKKINRTDENGDGLSDHFIEKYAEYCKGCSHE